MVRVIRTSRGWTQEDLARRLTEAGWEGPKVTQTIVARIEAATRPIRVNELYPLATALGTTVDEIIPGLMAPTFTPEAFAEQTARVQARLQLDDLKAQLTRAQQYLTSTLLLLDLMRTEGLNP